MVILEYVYWPYGEHSRGENKHEFKKTGLGFPKTRYRYSDVDIGSLTARTSVRKIDFDTGFEPRAADEMRRRRPLEPAFAHRNARARYVWGNAVDEARAGRRRQAVGPTTTTTSTHVYLILRRSAATRWMTLGYDLRRPGEYLYVYIIITDACVCLYVPITTNIIIIIITCDIPPRRRAEVCVVSVVLGIIIRRRPIPLRTSRRSEGGSALPTASHRPVGRPCGPSMRLHARLTRAFLSGRKIRVIRLWTARMSTKKSFDC